MFFSSKDDRHTVVRFSSVEKKYDWSRSGIQKLVRNVDETGSTEHVNFCADYKSYCTAIICVKSTFYCNVNETQVILNKHACFGRKEASLFNKPHLVQPGLYTAKHFP